MHKRMSLSQFLDDSSSDSGCSQQRFSFEPEQAIEQTRDQSLARTRNHNDRNPAPNSFSQFNFPETASSTASDFSANDGREIVMISGLRSRTTLRSTRNQFIRVSQRIIYRDYCKAMIAFNIQSLSEPYLREFITNSNINLDAFRNYIRYHERNIGGFDELKDMILPREHDSDECRAYKAAFKIGCEVFLKYFAVNWVFTGNIRNTKIYLRHRFCLLRKIKSLNC